MNTLHVKTGDTVVVLSGKNKGQKGKILSADPAKGTVIIEGVNMRTLHKKARRQGEVGSIVKSEGPVRACKVMLVCPRCGKAARTGRQVLADGTKTRVCKACGENV
jgi:large subunit ribosomal protein L24